MFLFDVYNLAYTTTFLLMFCISYFVVISMRLESLFKQSSVWQIRVFQILIALIIGYLSAKAIFSLVNF